MVDFGDTNDLGWKTILPLARLALIHTSGRVRVPRVISSWADLRVLGGGGVPLASINACTIMLRAGLCGSINKCREIKVDNKCPYHYPVARSGALRAALVEDKPQPHRCLFLDLVFS